MIIDSLKDVFAAFAFGALLSSMLSDPTTYLATLKLDTFGTRVTSVLLVLTGMFIASCP